MGRRTTTRLSVVLIVSIGGWYQLAGQPAGSVAAPPGVAGANPFVQQNVRRNMAAAGEGEEAAVLDGVFLPPPRKVKNDLQKVRELLAAGQFEDSVEFLGNLLNDQVLDSSEDYFFRPDPSQGVYRSLKAEAGSLVAHLPPAGRERYELLFGFKARDMLAAAVAKGDIAALAEISRRYLCTKAGCEATLLLARNHLDQGHPLAAALCYQRVRDVNWTAERFEPELSLALAMCWSRAGMPLKAGEVLSQLKEAKPGVRLRIGGKETPLFNSARDAAEWQAQYFGSTVAQGKINGEDWAMFRGDPARNAVSRGGRPLLNRRWSQDTHEHPATGRLVQQLRQQYIDQNVAAIPAMNPLAVGDVVLMRSARYLWAIDFQTGKRIWSYPNPDAGAAESDDLVPSGQSGQASNVSRQIEQRFWEDYTYGTLSSDGQRVFMIEDLDRPAGRGALQVINVRGMRNSIQGARPYNRLRALELASEGKLAWQVGDSHGLDEPQLAGAYFLGPPLPLLDRVYVLAEFKGEEIRVLCLSAKSGSLEWSQQLARVEQSVLYDSFRRTAGLSPSFADGVLVCPTATGAVVAVDMSTRNLLWGYQYPRRDPERPPARIFARNNNVFVPMSADRRIGTSWTDGSTTCAAGKVIITPLESDLLLCLNLIDGSLAWKRARDKKDLYVAGVHDDRVILVGQAEISALNLADGSAAWPESLELPGGAMPSGRGFFSGNYYHLPTTSAEVLEIDLATGQVAGSAKSRSGQIPGNLVAFRGDIISQSAERLDVFHQVEPLRASATAALAKNPNDATALAQVGEIRLDEGHTAEAVALLARSYERVPDDLTRQLLVESLLAGLASDFSSHQQSADKFAKLIEDENQRPRYLRLVAQGLLSSGQTEPAIDALLALADLNEGRNDMQEIDRGWSVRRDRWLQSQLAALRAAATPQVAARLDRLVEGRVRAALAAGSPAALRENLDLLSHEPAADAVRSQLVALAGGTSYLEREWLLLEMLQRGDEDRQRTATAQLAELFRSAGRTDSAADEYSRLLARWPDVPCLDGKTGRQLVDELPATHPIRARMERSLVWPIGVVKAEFGGTHTLSEQRQQRSFDVPIRGDAGPFLRNTVVAIEQQTQALFGTDPLGQETFRVDLSSLVSNPLAVNAQLNARVLRNLQVNGVPVQMGAVNVSPPQLFYGVARGHLLLTSVGYQVIAVDTLSKGAGERAGNADARVLWTSDLNDRVGSDGRISPRSVNVGWGLVRQVAKDQRGQPLGSVGPIRRWGVCYQRNRDIVCVHPLTGEVQWIRRGVTPGCDLFADDQHVIVCPFSAGEALVLRAMDGEILARRRVPPCEQRMTAVGSSLLLWTQEGGKPQVSLYDPVDDRTIWSRSFDLSTKAALAEPDILAAVEPEGRLWLLDLKTGNPLVAGEAIATEKQLSSIFLLPSSTGYLVLTNGPYVNRQGRSRNATAAPGGNNCFLINGRAYAFDRTTGKRLWGPTVIEQQGLLLRQPADSPLLVFARQSSAAAGRSTPAVSLWCLDRRSGEIVYPPADKRDEEMSLAINNLEVLADPTDSSVSVMLPNEKTLTLRLTDEVPPPAAPPVQPNLFESTLEAVKRALIPAPLPLPAPPEDAP